MLRATDNRGSWVGWFAVNVWRTCTLCSADDFAWLGFRPVVALSRDQLAADAIDTLGWLLAPPCEDFSNALSCDCVKPSYL
jgi:hypothetical protein